jgi:hypothetical protein
MKIKKGVVRAIFRYPDGRVEIKEGENLVVNYASLILSQTLVADPANPGLITYMAMGTGDAAVTSEDVLLEAEEDDAREPVTVNYYDVAGSEAGTITAEFNSVTITNKLLVEAVFDTALAMSIGEMGLFGGYGADTKEGGLLVCRRVLDSAWVKADGVDLTLQWLLVF